VIAIDDHIPYDHFLIRFSDYRLRIGFTNRKDLNE
jgi:hypothetical protein